ncbi:MAG: ABC transporter permease [Acutalibacteraceae bacterium]|nr:ABC transporter permease [Acutalibacteraceae bacterium]
MRALTFAKRNTKEILRDPLNLIFGLGFPLVLIALLSLIQSNIPVKLFEIGHLTPGIAVFGLSFMSLFSATIIAKDRSSSFLPRLYTTPMRSSDFILGYAIPFIPIALVQSVICYIAAVILGLNITLNILYAILFTIPVSLLYISLGILCGSILNDKQVGGICGALLTNLSAWVSGIWFDLSLMGEGFQKAAYALPFVHAVDMERAVLAGDFTGAFPHFWWVLGYATLLMLLAVLLFLRQMKRQ